MVSIHNNVREVVEEEAHAVLHVAHEVVEGYPIRLVESSDAIQQGEYVRECGVQESDDVSFVLSILSAEGFVLREYADEGAEMRGFIGKV